MLCYDCFKRIVKETFSALDLYQKNLRYRSYTKGRWLAYKFPHIIVKRQIQIHDGKVKELLPVLFC